jgi:hypothetical protein
MNNLPSIVRKNDLTFLWNYRCALTAEPWAIVARYDENNKKKYHQYFKKEGEWAEGTATPLPIFGIHLLQQHDSKENIFIFEGERCAEAAHHLGLTALTSMMGANQAANADWAILAQYRQHRNFVLVPDQDEIGKTYMNVVCQKILKACPEAVIKVCPLNLH